MHPDHAPPASKRRRPSDAPPPDHAPPVSKRRRPSDAPPPESPPPPPEPPEPKPAGSRAARRLEAFRDGFQAAVERVLRRLPGALAPATFVIGVPVPGSVARKVRVRPEDAPFASALDRLDERIAEIERSVGASERTRLGLTRAGIASAAATDVLREHGRRSDRESFCAGAVRMLNHHVIPVLQVSRDAYRGLPALRSDPDHGVHGFAEAVITAILREAEEELHKPHPGKSLYWLDPDVIFRAAGTALLFEVAAAGRDVSDAHALLDRLNVISATHYERRVGRGRVVIARPDHPAVRSKLRLATPIPLGEPEWTRKILEMASDGVALLSDSSHVLGLGVVSEEYDPAAGDLFVIEFVDHYRWELRHADAVLMRVEYGIPGLPHPPLGRAALAAVLARVLPDTPADVAKRLWRIVETATSQKHGTMIVISAHAEEEAVRLHSQGTPVEPAVLGDEMIRRVTSIDGAVLLDAEGRCHAVGVILDGRATSRGRPSRGARYNSALRYVNDAAGPTIAVVISEDGRVDVLPEG